MKYTKEDLMNTWGVVESKEHAEYIIELAKGAGFSLLEGGFNLLEGSNASGSFFAFSDVSLVFIASGCIASWGCKQITIPLPPKEREWVPQVGGVGTWGNEVCNGEIKAIDGDLAWLKNDWGNYVTEYVNGLKKPKTKQDLLIEELHQKLLASNCSDEYLLACDIVQGKIEGLSYE